METNEPFPTTDLPKISPSCEANPLTDSTVNFPPSPSYTLTDGLQQKDDK